MRIDVPAVSGSVIAELHARLLQRGSVLATADALDGGLESQVESILAETFSQLGDGGAGSPLVAVEYSELEVLSAHGQLSAALDIDPSEALMAAELLYGVALPLVADAAAEASGQRRDLDVARALHHAIWRRFPPGAIAYVEVLRHQLRSAHREARLRLARELHDRIAHGIAAGVQRLEAAQLGRPDEEVATAIGILRGALADTQDIAVDLRAKVGDKDLAEALEDYAFATGGRGTLPIHVTQVGAVRPLSDLAREELFTIVTEATRNARTHARQATAVQARLEWSSTELHITVTDDGLGYADGVRPPTSLGLHGMAERAGTIGATVEFPTAPGAAGVRLMLPFVGRSAM
ncbi:sensor histidine kinase [Agromyces laixinhei]|uniref:sensor histidine kinase n=1 Tax=Agromyces laixinhei TaxID=2585717 RepID=UPI0018DB7C83|nr:histidine kinase [Agromyces laixinhei]